MAVLAISAGLGCGELLGLRWIDVDLLTGTLTVRRQIVRSKVGSPKTKHSRRTLELGPEASAALEEQYAASRFTSDTDYVFPHPALRSAMDGATLRRTCAQRSSDPEFALTSGPCTTCAACRSHSAAP